MSFVHFRLLSSSVTLGTHQVLTHQTPPLILSVQTEQQRQLA